MHPEKLYSSELHTMGNQDKVRTSNGESYAYWHLRAACVKEKRNTVVHLAQHHFPTKAMTPTQKGAWKCQKEWQKLDINKERVLKRTCKVCWGATAERKRSCVSLYPSLIMVDPAKEQRRPLVPQQSRASVLKDMLSIGRWPTQPLKREER